MVDCQVSRRGALQLWVWTRPSHTRRARGAASTQGVRLSCSVSKPVLVQSGN